MEILTAQRQEKGRYWWAKERKSKPRKYAKTARVDREPGGTKTEGKINKDLSDARNIPTRKLVSKGHGIPVRILMAHRLENRSASTNWRRKD